jgi:hypothetical protein
MTQYTLAVRLDPMLDEHWPRRTIMLLEKFDQHACCIRAFPEPEEPDTRVGQELPMRWYVGQQDRASAGECFQHRQRLPFPIAGAE